MLRSRLLREVRHARIRKKVVGTPEHPRLGVSRSLNNIYAQIINDEEGRTLVSASTLDKEIRDSLNSRGSVEAAKEVGKLIAKRAKKKRIKQVVFDRGGYKYHGRVKALAEAARAGGLEF